MLSVDEALERVLELATPLESELVSVEDALGRVTTELIHARRTLPPCDVSAMDGYAVRRADLAAVPIELEVVETIFAGQAPERVVGPGEAARIMTGAPVPVGADAVVMQEKAALLSAVMVEILEQPADGANIRRAGEDVRLGALLFGAGTPLGLAEVGALWAQGLQRVAVHQRPTVAIASSGDELCGIWEEPRGRVVDTNSPVLAQAVKRAGGVPTELGISPDRLETLVQNLRRGLSHDVLITVAGASVGEKDYTREALTRLGVDIDFWKVAIKPGKPIAVGRAGRTLVFALPGNPVSALVTFELFVRPALRAMQGLPPAALRLPARTAAELAPARGVRHFVRATVDVREGELWATPLKTQSSGALASATSATHLIDLAPDGPPLLVGEKIVVIPLSWHS